MILSAALKPIAVTIGLGLSNHVGHCDKCNEVHPTISAAFESPRDDLEFSFGVYHNSYDKPGVFAAATWYPTDFTFIEAALTTGYEDQTGLPLSPFGRAGFQARYNFNTGRFDRHEGLGAAAFIFPSMTKDHRPALGAGLVFNYRYQF